MIRKQILTMMILLCCFGNLLFAQETITQRERELKNLFDQLVECREDKSKLSISEDICVMMREVLVEPESFDYSFELLPNMGKIMSPDQKLRLYCWNTVLENGDYRYFGLIQHRMGKKRVVLEELKDRGAKPENCMMLTTRVDNWLGGLYYQIVPFKSRGKEYYLLLGWDGNNYRTSRKIIEVLHFDKDGEAVFGDPVIEWRGKRLNRVVFEYAKQARMVLRYDSHQQQVVFDHLSPSSPRYNGQFEYYGPDFSHDALVLEKGVWKLYENIDVRNAPKGEK